MRSATPLHRVDFLQRRQLLRFAGIGIAGSMLLGSVPQAWAQDAQFPGVKAEPGGHKPTYLPASDDPVAHSIAENLFWNEQLLEHTAFFLMLMPGPELASLRAEVEKFRTVFTDRLAATKAARLDKGALSAFNQASIDQAQRFAEFKRAQRDAHASGKVRSLVWPTFFDHTAMEADYFARRLGRLSSGQVELERDEAVKFWNTIMGEHADFVAHLLDPRERELIDKATATSEAFGKLNQGAADAKKSLDATEQIIDFKVAAEEGIDAGKIRSIIHPTLADHVRREALKAADELRRVA